MTLPDFNITNRMHSRWCRFIIQRYLGQFLERNLSLDQLSVDLTRGEVKVEEVNINVNFVNEFLSTLKLPMKLIDGFIGKIIIEVPWTRLMSDSTNLRISDLQLTFQAQECTIDENYLASMLGSVVDKLVSSQELARSFYEDEEQNGGLPEEEESEGIQAFTKVIDAIVSRFCMQLTDTTIRFENKPPPNSEMCTAIEFRAKSMEFMDEQMKNCRLENRTADTITSQPHGIGTITNLNKYVYLSGVELFTDVFSRIDEVAVGDPSSSLILTSMYIRREKIKQEQQSPTVSPNESLSPDMFTSAMTSVSNFQSCHSSLPTGTQSGVQTFTDHFHVTRAVPELLSNPVKFAELAGEKCEIIIRIQNSDTAIETSDYKVDLEMICKGFNMFITPSQVEIIKKFFVSVSLPSSTGSRTELGKKMEKADYDVIVRAMEDITMQGAAGNRTTAFGGGNWRQQDDFREFDNVNLDDNRKNASGDAPNGNGYSSLKGTGRKESTHVKANLGVAVIVIAHNDVLSHENVDKLPNKHHDAIDKLHALSSRFFQSCSQLRINAVTPLHTIREQMDKLYPENHLRIVGSSFAVKFDVEKFSNVEHTKFTLNVSNLDFLEYLTSGSNPSEPSRHHYPLLDFSEMPKTEHEPHLKVVYAASTKHQNETQAQIVLGDCRIELDLSLVDRIADLIAPSPFFEPPFTRSRIGSMSRKEMHLSEDLFSTAQAKETNPLTQWKVSSNKIVLDLRIPIADLRNPNASRLPYRQKNVHPEFVRLTLQEPAIEVPINGEATSVTLTCSEMTGEFRGLSDLLKLSEDDLRFLFASKSQQRPIRLSFEYDPRNKSLKANAHVPFTGVNDDMTRSFSAVVVQSKAKREGPFSQIRRSFCGNSQKQVNSESSDDEEIIQAGSREEMKQFAEQSIHLSTSVLCFDVPILRLFITNHDFLEVLYNRLVNDLALWQPAAPSLRQSDSDLQINALGEKFHEYKLDKDDDEELQEESSYSGTSMFDRSKSHNFSFQMNVGRATMLMGTTMKQNSAVCGTSQTAVDLSDAQLFTVVGYHADLNRVFFHFTTNTISVGHRNCTSFEKRGPLSKNISGKDFAKWQRDECQLDFIRETDQFFRGAEKDALAIALDMLTRPEENIKDVLMAIAVRDTTAKLRPFRDTGHLWVTQLVDLFTLQDYEIQGYELPLVTNDIHVHLENVIIAYDHNSVNPASNSRLCFVIGETHITSSLIINMDVSKFTCIFDETQLWMSTEKAKESVHFDTNTQRTDNSFVRIGEIGLLHLEVLNCLLSGDQLHKRRSPLVEIRCKNDVIKVWTCADSLVAVINMLSEISESDAFKPIIEEEPVECDDVNESVVSSALDTDDTRSEAAASTWSRPASSVKPSANKLPVSVEQKLLAMIDSAVRESPQKHGDTVPVGTDALEEFKSDFANTIDVQDDLSVDSDSGRYRMHSLVSDEEFMMVEEGIIGCGITHGDGAPNIKVIGDVDLESVIVDPLHFRIPDEWRADGLGALQESFPPPLLRYMIRDVSLHIHLYGGSDFAKEEPKSRPYSDEDYKKGMGRGQKVLNEAKGGEHRDHSVSVVLEFNKINFLYQLYNKDAPVMCTNLMSVYDIVVKDRLQLSKINELLYQYSNSEQPRRTCAPVLAVRIVESHQQEGRMMVSMLPVKINLDQDTFNFLQDFVEDVSTTVRLPNDVVTAAANRPMIEVPAVRNPDKRKNSMIEKPATLSLEPLTPSPVQPPSPLGDLNYLVNRQSSSDALRNPILDDGPLTASAVSIGNLFGTRSSMTNRTSTPEYDVHSPDLHVSQKEPARTSSDVMGESLHLDDNLFDGMEGDWRSQSSAVNYNCLSDAIKERKPEVDDLLARSTMEGSFHPSYTTDDLVDTSTDFRESENDERSTVCDEDEGTEMAASGCENQDNDQPIRGTTFFKEFNFSPSATIYLDYHGKNRFSMDKNGAVVGVLKGIGQLNQAEIVLKEIHHNNGLLGVGRCFNHAANEWAEDINKNLKNIIASCGPISPIVQISKGFMDLFWMPVAEMRKEDGHVVKGIQKGVGSFGLSSAAGIVGIAQSMVGMVQTVAEAVLYEVQPDSAFLNRRNRRIASRQAAPTDLRHGIQLAYGIMSDGVRQTRTDLELAAQEERASGNTGVRSLLRFATPAVLRPLVMGTQMSYQLLGGLRHQLRPDMYQDERHKWRDEEVPGGRG